MRKKFQRQDVIELGNRGYSTPHVRFAHSQLKRNEQGIKLVRNIHNDFNSKYDKKAFEAKEVQEEKKSIIMGLTALQTQQTLGSNRKLPSPQYTPRKRFRIFSSSSNLQGQIIQSKSASKQ